MITRRVLLIITAFAALLLSGFLISTYALFSGSHSIYTNKTNATEFCTKCHAGTVTNVTAGSHANAGCICHGYNPNTTAAFNVNVAHNLTKQIYCTNCHTNYDENGEITIYTGISGLNQSAHYITNNTTTLYTHAQNFFS
jgi:nitrate/TMAO reductase-like tetraheme cytochrome c subunit